MDRAVAIILRQILACFRAVYRNTWQVRPDRQVMDRGTPEPPSVRGGPALHDAKQEVGMAAQEPQLRTLPQVHRAEFPVNGPSHGFVNGYCYLRRGKRVSDTPHNKWEEWIEAPSAIGEWAILNNHPIHVRQLQRVAEPQHRPWPPNIKYPTDIAIGNRFRPWLAAQDGHFVGLAQFLCQARGVISDTVQLRGQRRRYERESHLYKALSPRTQVLYPCACST